jgi:hypothetical protein
VTSLGVISTTPNAEIVTMKKEETSHLYAHCTGLTQIRMLTIGKLTLEENFEWTPYQLLAMIEKIDKICPEEGLPTNLGNPPPNRSLTPDSNPNNVE